MKAISIRTSPRRLGLQVASGTHKVGVVLSVSLLATAMIMGFGVSSNAQVDFTMMTSGVVANSSGISAGVSWGDYDNDGNVDLFVTNWSNQDNFLYLNNGDASFTSVLSGDIVDEGSPSVYPYSSGPCWGDYDNDGYLDMFVANQQNVDNFLYHNNGDSTFEKITEGEIVSEDGASFASAWGDYNNDGYLDLIVANAFGQTLFLYRNNGQGGFEKVTTGVIVSTIGQAFGATWGDYNNDGLLDLFVANRENMNNALYTNNGDETFTLVTGDPVVTDGSYSHGGSWGDYDNDGDLDLFVANGPYGGTGQDNRLYENNGDGHFSEITTGPVVSDASRSGNGTWADFDNDGDLDLFVTAYFDTDLLYLNDGEGDFTQVTEGLIVQAVGYSSGNAVADYDNDGDLDLVVANWENQNNFMFRNDITGANWVEIKCLGTVSNSYGVGAQVRIRATIEGSPVWQLREIATNHGHRSQNVMMACFGLGDATVIDSVMIRWPSGIVDTIVSVDPNHFYSAVEGMGILCSTADTDGDGLPDVAGDCPGDNCPDVFNPDQFDLDDDGIGDVCDAGAFTKYAGGDVVSDGEGSRSVNFIDVNNDSRLDLFITNGEAGGENNMLYMNSGNGVLDQVLSGIVVSDGNSSDGATFGDFNNDGYLDAFVANWYNQNNLLYRNDSGQSWTQVTSEIPANDAGYSEAASWADYDSDGDLDLFVANSGGDLRNFLYQNNGDGSFIRLDTGAVSTEAVESRCGVWADYDNDGDLDLFVANEGYADNSLFENLDGESFLQIMTGDIVTNGGISWGASWGDYDNDGNLDLFVANNSGQPNFLYHNEGDKSFTRVDASPVMADYSYSAGSAWIDYDNDGDLDLFVANGWGPTTDTKDANLFYENDGAGNFTKLTDLAIVADSGWSYGCAWGDIDNDGDQDLAVARWMYEAEHNTLYRNDTGSANSWINVNCIGVVSNNSGIGTRVQAQAVIGSVPVMQTHEISSQTGYACQNSLNVEFGFGDATTIDSLVITWPSGIVDHFSSVDVNQFVTVVEGSGVLCYALDSDRDGAVDPGQLGVVCPEDNCPTVYNADQDDVDEDSVGDQCDNCPEDYNPGQEDSDGNGTGDECEGCCGEFSGGITGNANCSVDGKLTLSDISRMIDRVYISKGALCCEASGNTNADAECKITLSDITVLIDAVFISKADPELCMLECES